MSHKAERKLIVRHPPKSTGWAVLLCALVAGLVWYAFGGGRAVLVGSLNRNPSASHNSQEAQRAVDLVKLHRADDAQVTVSQRLEMLQSWLQARGIKLKTEAWRGEPAPDIGPRAYRVKYSLDEPDWSRSWVWHVSLLGSKVEPANDAAVKLRGQAPIKSSKAPPSPQTPRTTPEKAQSVPPALRLLGVLESDTRAVALIDVTGGLREAVPGDVVDGWSLQSAIHKAGGASYVVLQRGGDRRTVRIGDGLTPPAVLNLPPLREGPPVPQDDGRGGRPARGYARRAARPRWEAHAKGTARPEGVARFDGVSTGPGDVPLKPADAAGDDDDDDAEVKPGEPPGTKAPPVPPPEPDTEGGGN